MLKCKSCSNSSFASLKFFYVCKKCKRLYSLDEIKSSIDYLVNESRTTIKKEEFKNGKFDFIKIPKNIISIEESSFENCRNLQVVFFENDSKLESIKDNAFYNSNNLIDIELPTTVNDLGFNVFGNTKLSKLIYIYKGAKYIGTKSNKYLMLYESMYELEEVELHKDTRFILNSAFVDDLIIKKLILNKNLIEIGEYAFDGCKNLREIVKVENKQKINIKDCAFLNCNSLKNTF